jgi:hypothetical protein
MCSISGLVLRMLCCSLLAEVRHLTLVVAEWYENHVCW